MSYTAYNPIDELWLTDIPEHWDSRKIKYAFSERVEKGYPDEQLLVASQNMGVVPKGIYGNRTVEATKDLHNLKLVRVGDFVISLRSFQGGLEYAYYQGIISPAYTVMIPNDRISSGYFRFLAKSRLFIELLQMCVTGIREGQNIDYNKLKNHLIPVPPRDEQDQIARYLDWKVSRINKLISAKRRQIALLQEQKQTLINEAVTEGGKGWQTVKLKHLCQQIGDIDHKMPEAIENGIPYISPINFIGNNEIDFENCKKISQNSFNDLSRKIRPNNGDIIFSRYATLGAVRLVKDSRDFLVSYSCVILKPNESILSAYLYYFLISNAIVNEIKNYSFETTQANVGVDSINRFKIMLPTIQTQQDIVAYLDQQCASINSIVSKLNDEISLFTEYRTRLISDVVTGKLDVRGVAIPEYEPIEESANEEPTDDDTMLEMEE